jgi:hypothetical protein
MTINKYKCDFITGVFMNFELLPILTDYQLKSRLAKILIFRSVEYLKIERDGTTINHYLVKVGDDPATEGTLLYTSSKILSADTELFLDGSFLGCCQWCYW